MTRQEPPGSLDGPSFLEAIAEGRRDEALKALKHDPSLACHRREGVGPILLALFSGDGDLAELLAQHDADVDFCEAAAMGSTARLRDLWDTKRRASLDDPGPHGWTPLHLAAFLGRWQASSWLVEHGADPGVISRNREANTPLHAALAGRGDQEVIRILLEAGADPRAHANLGVTPLHLAASRGNRSAVDLLIAFGATPEAMEDGRYPSAVAVERGHADLAGHLENLE